MEEQAADKRVKKISLTDFLESHPNATFWTRFVLWTMFSCVLPFVFILWRFDLFKTVSKIQVGGWGIVAIIVVAVFVFTVIRYVKMALNAKYSLLGQILGGFCKIIIPLLAALFILKGVRDNVDLMIQVLGCVTLCEAVAIPLNPLPKWAYDMQKDVRAEERKETFDYLLDGFFKRKKDAGDE